jgi:hypothetical protein
VLERVGFDRVVERGGIRRMLARSKYDPSDIIAKLVFYGLLLVTLQIAFGLWGPNPVSALLTAIVAWLPRAVVAIIIVVVAGAIAQAVNDMIRGTLGGLSYGNLLGTIASVFIWGLGIIAALNQIGVATTVTMPVLIAVLATISGVLIVGVGGGLVRPMQQRWERWLGRAENEIPAIRAQTQAYQRGREDVVRAGVEPTERLQPEPTERLQPEPTYAGTQSRTPSGAEPTMRQAAIEDPTGPAAPTQPIQSPPRTESTRSTRQDSTRRTTRRSPDDRA